MALTIVFRARRWFIKPFLSVVTLVIITGVIKLVIFTRTNGYMWRKPFQSLSHYAENDRNATTLVTAYFDIGGFQKGSGNHFYSTKMYFRWAEIFHYMENPLVCYTDSKSFFDHMTALRKGKEHKTKIFLIDRNSSWAYQWKPRVVKVISQPGYPRHHPNTVVPEYTCATFAKFDLIKRASEADFFKTRYIGWIDIGHFRQRHSNKSFELVKLDSHDESRVAISQAYKVSFDRSPKKIILENLVWIGAAFMFGNREKMITFADQFKKAVDYFLSQNMINTEQPVIYAMYTDQGRKIFQPEVEIQSSQATGWFGLGLKMVKELNDSTIG